MTLIEILITLRFKSTQERQKFLEDADIPQELWKHIQESFNDTGDLIDSEGYAVSLYTT